MPSQGKNMRKRIALPLFASVILAALLCVFAFSGTTASADTYGGDYRYEFDDYNIVYDISANSEIRVTEVIKVNYLGRNSTGFMRDIPTNAGAQVKDISVEGVKLITGDTDVPYEVRIDDSDFVTVDIGDSLGKFGKSETYRLSYLYCLGNTTINEGKLSLNPIGSGNSCNINHAKITLVLPDGYISGSAVRYVGALGEDDTGDKIYSETVNENGRTVITTETSNLKPMTAVTFDLAFEEGAIGMYFDFTPYWFVIAAAALLLLTICVKLFLFSRTNLTPVVNFEAPEGMDPLIMGKLIDNKVNSEDVTALIFYWADKGYLKINLDDKDNPTIIRIKNLPATAESYEHTVFSGLFKNGDAVRTNDLKYVFYPTFERATALANEKAKGLYMSSSIGVSIIFALLSGLLIGIAPFVLGIMNMSLMTYLFGFIALIPALVLYGFTESIMYNKLKNRGGKNVLFGVLLALGILACTAAFTFIIPSSVMPLIPKLLICLICFTNVSVAVCIISRTREYTEKLNQIVGFRNFILCAEKDRLEALLESDPQYYYHVLPYAQVLNVSDIWEEKFKNLTVAPPAWATSSSFEIALDFMILNSLIRHSMTSIASGMISRPSASGMNGGGMNGFGGFGGSFGGHSGGGFGGGGSRGR